MYEVIMDLPLFQGVSHNKISELIEKTRFHFLKYKKGETIVSTGDVCGHVRFIISGEIKLEICSVNKRVSVSELLKAPNVIGADYLFGRDTTYPFTVTAMDDCGILQIEKADYIKIIQSDKVFLFNILNNLSRNSQKAVCGIMSLSSGSIAERLAFMVETLTQKGGYGITIDYKQKDICQIFGVQRTSFVNALVALKADGIIDYTPSQIKILDRSTILEILHSKED